MAPLGSPTKTTTSSPSTTGLPMIAPSASPGSGDRLVPGRAIGAPCRPRRPRADTEGDEARPVGGDALRQPALERLRSVRPGEAVVGRPGERDVAGAGPEDHRVRRRPPRPGRSRRRTGADRTARPVQRTGRVADPDRGDRWVCAVAVAVAERQDAVAPGDRSPDRRARSRGAARSPRSRRHRSTSRRCPARRPLRRRRPQRPCPASRRRRRSAPKPPASGSVDQRPGEVRGRDAVARRWPAARRWARPPRPASVRR